MKTKLQKQLECTEKDKRQYRHVIVIPEEAVNELGWNDGRPLELTIADWRLIIETKE
jgi:bifunctional DNA-binding transcriptional regulator/antitoxin component of YhaV-PrlF toxin-antitoxin module